MTHSQTPHQSSSLLREAYGGPSSGTGSDPAILQWPCGPQKCDNVRHLAAPTIDRNGQRCGARAGGGLHPGPPRLPPRPCAALAVGVSPTAYKRNCRRLGALRWNLRRGSRLGPLRVFSAKQADEGPDTRPARAHTHE